MTYLAPCGCAFAAVQKGQAVPLPLVRCSLAELVRVVGEARYWAGRMDRCPDHRSQFLA